MSKTLATALPVDSHGPVRIGHDVQILENTVLHLLPDNQLGWRCMPMTTIRTTPAELPPSPVS